MMSRLQIAVLALIWSLHAFACGRPVGDLPLCGNGMIDPGEECDDANSVELDGCSRRCGIAPILVTELAASVVDVAMTAAGEIVVAWWEEGVGNTSGRLRWRAYGQSGVVERAGEWPVALRHGLVQLAMREDGDIVIAWGKSEDTVSTLYISGAAATKTDIHGPNAAHDIAVLPDGRFAVAWREEGRGCGNATGVSILSPAVGLLNESILDDTACVKDGGPRLAAGPAGELLVLYVRTEVGTGVAELVAQHLGSTSEAETEMVVDAMDIEALHSPDVPGLFYYLGGVYIGLHLELLPGGEALALAHRIEAGEEYLGRVWVVDAAGTRLAINSVFPPPSDEPFSGALAGVVPRNDGRYWLAWRDRDLQATLLQQFATTAGALGTPLRARTLPGAQDIEYMVTTGTPDGRLALLWWEWPGPSGGVSTCYIQRFDRYGRVLGSLPW
jgi:cysteine-rich repeat protein